jgi:hypothetical protein
LSLGWGRGTHNLHQEVHARTAGGLEDTRHIEGTLARVQSTHESGDRAAFGQLPCVAGLEIGTIH